MARYLPDEYVRAKDFLDIYKELGTTYHTHLSGRLLVLFKRNMGNAIAYFLRSSQWGTIVISTYDNSAVLKDTSWKFSLLMIHDASRGFEYDNSIPNQLQHTSLAVLGNDCQVQPVVAEGTGGEFYKNCKVSFFERLFRHCYGTTSYAKLETSYSRCQDIARPVDEYRGGLGEQKDIDDEEISV